MIRPLERVPAREMWAAIWAAQAAALDQRTTVEAVADRLDTPAGKVDRALLALRLAAMAARGLLDLTPDRRWVVTARGKDAAAATATRQLGDVEVWQVVAACHTGARIDTAAVATRLGVAAMRVDLWCRAQEATGGRCQPVDGRWQVTPAGRAALAALDLSA
ncbi:hypothetical protein MXD61_04790 [Frankia sp. AgPm24]|uniref:hypothetical protein n=1 Tax=Frankia sp. AgPm24 TaxID=631128 RepID=UPI00200E7B3F|nr:hypothetical protein [Frankia sp. AgPm24]MCK9921225.1 hypothetical protein [Frankia sp. AgPm24]